MDALRPSSHERVRELREKLKAFSEAYYGGKPEVSDLEYDKLYLELKQLEAKQTQDDSQPSGTLVGKPGNFPHGVPMPSFRIEVDSSYTGYKRFIRYLLDQMAEKGIDSETIAIEAQHLVSGLDLNLQYWDGKLFRVLTRNNGEVGEDVTECLELFQETIPEVLKDDLVGLTEIHGRAVLSNKEFQKLNSFLESHGEPTHPTPRNAVSSMIRAKDPSKYPEAILEFFPHGLGLQELSNGHLAAASESEFIAKAEQWGFHVPTWFRELFVVVPYQELQPTEPQLAGPYGFFVTADDVRESWGSDYVSDGIIYKLDSFEHQRTLGSRGIEPRWAVIQKFASSARLTTLREVLFDVGRTGKITPVARVDPVSIDGLSLSKATLHNVFDIRRRNIRVGDEVVLYRSGETTPELGYRPKQPARVVYRPNIRLPRTCPACNATLKRLKGEINTYCTSPFCAGRKKALLRYFVSKEGMDIQGFSPDLVNRLYDAEVISEYISLFDLDVQTLVKFDVAPALAEQIVQQLELALRKEDWRFLASLGIRNVGQTTAKQICRLFPLQELPTLSLDQWLNIPGVDTKTAYQLWSYFQNKSNTDSFKATDWWTGARFLKTQVDPFRKLYNKTIVFSGTFEPPHRRIFLETVVGVEGGVVAKEVRPNTYALVIGHDPTPRKLAKAQELNVPIWSAHEFLKFTGEAPY